MSQHRTCQHVVGPEADHVLTGARRRTAKSRVSTCKAALPSVDVVPTAMERVMTTDTAEEVRFRTHVHHHNHHVLVAVSGRDGRGIGAARWIRHEQAHDSADVELSVDDTWQGTDVGAQLLRRL